MTSNQSEIDSVKLKELIAADRAHRQISANEEIQRAINTICEEYRCRIQLVMTVVNGVVSQHLEAIAID